MSDALELDGRRRGACASRTRTSSTSPSAGSRRPTSCATSSRSATASSAPCATGRRCWSAGPAGWRGEAIFQRRIAHGRPGLGRGRARTGSTRPSWRSSPGRRASARCASTRRRSRARSREPPDELRIDLDPQPGTGFRDAVAVAAELRGLLADAGLAGLPKTTGGRGPARHGADRAALELARTWPRAQAALARELVRRMPHAATMERLKRDRGARVYVDHGQFLVAAAYSIRAGAARARVGAAHAGTSWRRPSRRTSTWRRCPARFRRLGDLRPSAPAGSIEALL